MKLLLIFVVLNLVNSLSWTNRRFCSDKLPDRDLSYIDRQQSIVISQLWYSKIMGDEFGEPWTDPEWDDEDVHEITRELQKAMDTTKKLDEDQTIQSINRFESVCQEKNSNNYIHLAWMPTEIKTNLRKEVLAIIVCSQIDNILKIKSIVCNPDYIWSDNIPLLDLKKALRALTGNKLDLGDFLKQEENQRILLEWSFFS